MSNYAAPPPGFYNPSAGYVYARPASNDGAAIAAFVLSLFSIFIWVVPSVVAFTLARGAKRNIAASQEARKGKGFATAAEVISSVTFILWSLLFAIILLAS